MGWKTRSKVASLRQKAVKKAYGNRKKEDEATLTDQEEAIADGREYSIEEAIESSHVPVNPQSMRATSKKKRKKKKTPHSSVQHAVMPNQIGADYDLRDEMVIAAIDAVNNTATEMMEKHPKKVDHIMAQHTVVARKLRKVVTAGNPKKQNDHKARINSLKKKVYDL